MSEAGVREYPEELPVGYYLNNFQRILDPGHPQADESGYVSLPNVKLPNEMVNLTVAARAYQANVAVLKRYQNMVESTLELLR